MNRIREARKKAGLKQTDLCARLGISQGALSGWENGKYEPDNAGWLTLSECLNASIDYLMGVPDVGKKKMDENATVGKGEGNTESIFSVASDSEKRIIEALPFLSEDDLNAVYGLITHLAAKNQKEDNK